jgi:hypothetical protein
LVFDGAGSGLRQRERSIECFLAFEHPLSGFRSELLAFRPIERTRRNRATPKRNAKRCRQRSPAFPRRHPSMAQNPHIFVSARSFTCGI